MAWLDLHRGARAEAEADRGKVAFYGGRPEPDGMTQALEVEHQMSIGHPDRALDLAGKLAGTHARALRATRRSSSSARAKDAVGEADELVKLTTPEARREQSKAGAEPRGADRWRAGAHLSTNAGNGKDTEDKEMYDSVGQRTSKIALHAYAMAEHALGEFGDARGNFKVAVENLDNAGAPNPVAERSLTWYADTLIEIARDEAVKNHDDATEALGTAKASLDKAVAINAAYLPVQAIRAKLALYEGDAEAASKLLEPVIRELGTQYPAAQLVWAEVLVARRAADPAKAQQILDSIKDRILPAAMVGRVAAMIDPKLPEQLGVPGPELPKPPPGPAQPPRPPGRRR